jgi:hypothetical protein
MAGRAIPSKNSGIARKVLIVLDSIISLQTPTNPL